MRHARPDTLDTLEDLLAQIRRVEGLRERKRGTFYRGSNAFLHFHEDPAGIFADLKIGGGWKRLRVQDAEERADLLAAVRAAVSDVGRKALS